MPIPLHIDRPKKTKGPGILVLHSWWGLTPSVQKYCRDLADRGFVVAAPDLFDGRQPKTVAQARYLRSLRRKEPIYKVLTRNIFELLANTAVDGKEIGVIGFSMGGHWAVWLSQQPQLPIASTVLYYAARGGNFKKSHSAFLAHFAESDEWVSETAKARMAKAIQSAGLSLESYTYARTKHWFAESGGNTKSNKAVTQLAFERTIERLRRTLTL